MSINVQAQFSTTRGRILLLAVTSIQFYTLFKSTFPNGLFPEGSVISICFARHYNHSHKTSLKSRKIFLHERYLNKIWFQFYNSYFIKNEYKIFHLPYKCYDIKILYIGFQRYKKYYYDFGNLNFTLSEYFWSFKRYIYIKSSKAIRSKQVK